MIPKRIKLSGFLSYKEERELPFDGAAVWLLAGSNGSGKSAIFDAITYALFGHHRGGSQNAIELINKESNAFEVEFDFLLDGATYRIRRTLKRTKGGSATGTQQVFRAIDGGDDWIPVEDTNKRIDFDGWIHERIGLNYETFTSSVLLLQGKAEKLLDSKPSGRAEVLAGIVDLERYQKLHERANGKKNILKGQLESLDHQSKAVPEVTELEYAIALGAIERAETERQTAAAKLESLRDLEILSRKWMDAQTRLAETREKLKRAEYLLGSAVKIEAAHARFVELRDALPAAHAVVTTRGRLNESERRTERFLKERDAAIQRQSLAEANQKTARQKRDTLRIQIEKYQKELEAGGARLRELSGILKSVELAEDQQSRLAECDRQLASFADEPAAAVRTARAEVERLQELARVLPILQRIHDERNELKSARQTEAVSEKRLGEVRMEGETRKESLNAIEREQSAALFHRSTADELAAGAAVLAKRATDLLAEFDALSGETTCRTCGQALAPAHFEEEKARRASDLESARSSLEAATSEQRTATARERDLLERETALKSELEKLREGYRDAETERKQAANDTARHLRTLKLAYAELPRIFSQRIAPNEPSDWTATRFPERDELSNLTHETDHLDAARRSLRAAEESLDRWKQLRADRESSARSLERLQSQIPAGDVLAIRREYGNLQAGESTLQNALRAARSNVDAVEDEIDRHGKDAHAATTTRTEIVGKLRTEDAVRAHCRETIDREMKKLSPEWQTAAAGAGLNEYHEWKSEHDALVADETEATFRKLEVARGGLDVIRGEIRERESTVADFPDDAKQHVDQVKMQAVAAKTNLEDRERDLNTARQTKTTYDFHRERRATLGEQSKQVDGELSRYKLLAELLGRDRLQRHLVRQAERQIVDCANGVLDRLSGGQLFLRLTGADDGAGADRALDLECTNRVAGGAPINVMFLSGSQKFRVAVSLALGIGQYASRQHRPIESVIIDEGFGCLDRQGRQTMIQELQNLRGHLHCILLVSHQEEFAEAFSDGYRFELVDGATKVTRFQR